MRLNQFLYLLFFLIGGLLGFAQSAKPDSVSHPGKAGIVVTERGPQNGFETKYTSQADFKYGRKKIVETNFIADFFKWLFGKFGKVLGPSFRIPLVLQWVLWFVAAGCLVWVVVKTKFYRFFYTVTDMAEHNYTIDGVKTEGLDFDGVIAGFVRAGEYRNAVRYGHLRAINALQNKKLIAVAANKTNFDYYRELVHPELKQRFKMLTWYYNHIWYGDMAIDATMYATIAQDFNQFQNQLNEPAQ